MAMSESKTLIFVHIPKTAGSSLIAVLEKQYPVHRTYSTSYGGYYPDGRPLDDYHGSVKSFYALPPERLAQIDLLYGHMPYGLHEKLPRPAEYFTFLREPVSRLISNYFFEGRTPNSPLYELVRSGAMDLEAYHAHIVDVGIDNIQTRMIAGIFDPAGGPPVTPDILRRAEENLTQCFALVGLQEAFEDSYLMLRHRYGWRYYDFPYRNVAPRSQNTATVPDDVRERIARQHRYDLALYKTAQAIFARQWAEMGKTLELERMRLRSRRPIHRLSAGLQDTYWQMRRFSVRYWLRRHVARRT